MTTEIKVLGKIEQVEFGIIHDMPHLFGLTLCLATSEASGVVEHIVANMKRAELSNDYTEVVEINEEIYQLLNDAKVLTIDELVGVPIEMTFDKGFFERLESFRILTEVL